MTIIKAGKTTRMNELYDCEFAYSVLPSGTVVVLKDRHGAEGGATRQDVASRIRRLRQLRKELP